MTTRLPLVAAQPGIWMAERLSTLPGAWSVAHYVELRGALDPTLLGKAIVAGLQQADTLSLRFEEEEGEVWQWLAADRTFAEPSIIDLRTAPDPHRAATERMQAEMDALTARRAALTAERQKARREEQDYAAVRRNVEEFLSPPRQAPARQKDMELE